MGNDKNVSTVIHANCNPSLFIAAMDFIKKRE